MSPHRKCQNLSACARSVKNADKSRSEIYPLQWKIQAATSRLRWMLSSLSVWVAVGFLQQDCAASDVRQEIYPAMSGAYIGYQHAALIKQTFDVSEKQWELHKNSHCNMGDLSSGCLVTIRGLISHVETLVPRPSRCSRISFGDVFGLRMKQLQTCDIGTASHRDKPNRPKTYFTFWAKKKWKIKREPHN